MINAFLAKSSQELIKYLLMEEQSSSIKLTNMLYLDYKQQKDIRSIKMTFYMNPYTGSVATIEEWQEDFENRDDKAQTWEEWGGDTLIEVTKNEEGEWQEVK